MALQGAAGYESSAADLVAFSADAPRTKGRRAQPALVSAMMTDEADPGDPRHGLRVPRRSVLGYGGGVDIVVRNPWNVVGRYGWVGRTDTSGDVVPSDNCNAVLLTPGQTRSPPAVPPFRNRSGRQPSLATTPEAAGPIVSPKRQRLGPERQTTRGKRLGLADRQHRADLDIPAGSGTGLAPRHSLALVPHRCPAR